MNEHARQSRGFTLVELMMAMVIGMVVTGALIAMFMSSKRTYSTTENLARMQESARFATQFAARELRMAGYATGTQSGILNRDLLFPARGVFGAGVVLFGRNNDASPGFKAGADSIRIRYSGDGNGAVADCLGAAVAANAQVDIQLSLSSADELRCSTDGGITQTVLVDGISDMQLKFAVDTSGDRYADSVGGVTYVDAGAVGNWSRVASVRLALRAAGAEQVELAARTTVAVVAVRNQLP